MPDLPKIDIRPDHWEIVRSILEKHVSQYDVWAFGSRAKWTAKEYSDLDLAVISDKPLPLKVSASLCDDFMESDLPWKVDVVDWATTSESFKKIIERDKVVVQKAEKSCAMGEWNEVQLSDIAVISSGKRPPCSVKEMTSDCRTPIIGGGGISGYTNAHLFDGDILITGRVGTLGKLFAPSVPCWPSDNALVIRPGSSTTHPHFLRYALQSVIAQAADMNRGAANPLITQGDLGRLNIWHPPLHEQRAIAHILGTLDDKIELNRRQSETLQEMARALFKAWFVDFEPVHAKMSGRWQRGQTLPGLPAHLWDLFPDRLVETEHGEVPQGWRLSTIGQEVTVCGGSTPSTKNPDFWEGGNHCWVTPKDLSKVKFPVLLDTERKITDAGLAKISSGLLPVGTVLLSSRAPIGYLAIAAVPTAINQGFIAMKCEGVLPSTFVLLWCMENMEAIIGRANGSTFQEISKSNFRPLPVVVPPAALLESFAEKVDTFYRQLFENEKQSHTLAALRDTLLPQLLSGALRVSDAEKFLHGESP